MIMIQTSSSSFVRLSGFNEQAPFARFSDARGFITRDRTLDIVDGKPLSPAMHAAAQRVAQVMPAAFKKGLDHEALSQFVVTHYAALGLSFEAVNDPEFLGKFIQTVLELCKKDLASKIDRSLSTSLSAELKRQLDWLGAYGPDSAIFLQRALYRRFYLNALSLARIYEVQRSQLERAEVMDDRKIRELNERIVALRERAAAVFAQAGRYDANMDYDQGSALPEEDSLVADLASFQSLVSTDSIADVPAPSTGDISSDGLEKGGALA